MRWAFASALTSRATSLVSAASLALASALAVLAVSCPARVAHAEEGDVSMRRLVPLSPLNLIPAALGGEVAFGPRATNGPIFVLGWPIQIQVHPGDVEPSALNHRVVLTPELALGSLHASDPDRTVEGALRFRSGYRVVWHPGGGLAGILAGIGSTVDFYPIVQPSISPEIGLHIGDPLAIPKVTLVLRMDQYFAADNLTRASLMVGWAFY